MYHAVTAIARLSPARPWLRDRLLGRQMREAGLDIRDLRRTDLGRLISACSFIHPIFRVPREIRRAR